MSQHYMINSIWIVKHSVVINFMRSISEPAIVSHILSRATNQSQGDCCSVARRCRPRLHSDISQISRYLVHHTRAQRLWSFGGYLPGSILYTCTLVGGLVNWSVEWYCKVIQFKLWSLDVASRPTGRRHIPVYTILQFGMVRSVPRAMGWMTMCELSHELGLLVKHILACLENFMISCSFKIQ